MGILDTYHYFNSEIADPRTNEWAMMSSPVYPLLTVGIYVYMALYAVPKFMHNRKPYELKEFIILYNIYQVFICTYMTYKMLGNGLASNYVWLCQGVDTSNNPLSVEMANLVWWMVLVKMSEFIETIVFALRKKHNQISFLHVYHHISTFFIIWIGAKYYPGGSYVFPTILNNAVHVIMYSYYLLSLYKSPSLQAKLIKFKPYITRLQMVQFTILLLFAGQGLRPSCKVPKMINWIFTPNVLIVFYLFYKFYRDQYTEENKAGKTP